MDDNQTDKLFSRFGDQLAAILQHASDRTICAKGAQAPVHGLQVLVLGSHFVLVGYVQET